MQSSATSVVQSAYMHSRLQTNEAIRKIVNINYCTNRRGHWMTYCNL